MISELTSDITRFMDKYVESKWKIEGFNVYIYTTKTFSGELVPEEQIYDKDNNFWYVRYPGYTCANIVFNRRSKKITKILLTKRKMYPPTVFTDPDALAAELNKRFVNTIVTYDKIAIEEKIKENS